MRWRTFIIISILFLTCSCTGRSPSPSQQQNEVGDTEVTDSYEPATPVNGEGQAAKSRAAVILDSLGYVDIKEYDPRIEVELVYATPDNFVGEILYEALAEAYLLPEAAKMLSKALDLLKEIDPDYGLLVYDAARPMSAQRKMWNAAVKAGKQYYVANPAKGGGLHNYGAAVDVTITDGSGMPLPMGTGYDHLGPEANTDKEKELAAAGKISRYELENRLLLRKVMKEAGFRTVKSEWWHFNLCPRDEAVKKYMLIDF